MVRPNIERRDGKTLASLGWMAALLALTCGCPHDTSSTNNSDATQPDPPFFTNPLGDTQRLAELSTQDLQTLCGAINQATAELRGLRGLRAFCVAGALSQGLADAALCQNSVESCRANPVMPAAIAPGLECTLLDPAYFSGCDIRAPELAACINDQAREIQPLFDAQRCDDGLDMTRLNEALANATAASCTSLEHRCPALLDLTCPLQGRCQGQPRHAFVADAAPAAPDYSQDSAWMLLPETFTLGDWAPPQINRERDLHDKPVDVFFVHPTTFERHENWNSPVPPLLEQNTALQAIGFSEASVFSGCCQVFAPHYREATLHAFFAHLEDPPRDDGRRALELAYDDVRRAFANFVAQRNHGRPFIIASHSQGTLHALRLLAEEIDGSAIDDSLVAAYTLGFAAPQDMFARGLGHTPPCDAASQTGCLLHWDTFARGATRPFAGFHYYPGAGWEEDGNKAILCVNPLSWRAGGGWVGADQHLGALSSGGMLQVALTPAGCVDGMLQVDRLDDALYPGLLDQERGVYHGVDFALFYADLRANAIERCRGYLGR